VTWLFGHETSQDGVDARKLVPTQRIWCKLFIGFQPIHVLEGRGVIPRCDSANVSVGVEKDWYIVHESEIVGKAIGGNRRLKLSSRICSIRTGSEFEGNGRDLTL